MSHLVISRRLQESVKIGSDIEVRVLKIRTPDGRLIVLERGWHVQLGISAPAGVRILREELVQSNAPEG